LSGGHAWAALSLFLGGCATYNPHLDAAPTPRGTTDFGVSADALLVDRGVGPELLPAPDVSLRRGLGADWDLGVRLFPLGAEVSARRRVYDAGRYELALLPLLWGGLVTLTNADTSLFATSAGLTALNGFKLSERSDLTLGLRAGVEVGLNAVAVREDFSAARWRLLAGGSVSLRYRVSNRWSLSPGVIALVPYDLDYSRARVPIVQGGVAVGF